MNTQDLIESRLTQALQLADAGFSERVMQDLRKRRSARKMVFLSAGLIWLLLAGVLLLPAAIQAGSTPHSVLPGQFISMAKALIQAWSRSVTGLSTELVAVSNSIGAATAFSLFIALIAVSGFLERD